MPLTSTRSVSASIAPAEPLSSLLGLKSEHRVALLTTGVSLLTIAAGVSLAMRRSRRTRRSSQRQPSRKMNATVGYKETAAARVANIHDAPPMFHEPPTHSHGVDNALNRLIHEFESHRVDRPPPSEFAPKNYRRMRRP